MSSRMGSVGMLIKLVEPSLACVDQVTKEAHMATEAETADASVEGVEIAAVDIAGAGQAAADASTTKASLALLIKDVAELLGNVTADDAVRHAHHLAVHIGLPRAALLLCSQPSAALHSVGVACQQVATKCSVVLRFVYTGNLLSGNLLSRRREGHTQGGRGRAMRGVLRGILRSADDLYTQSSVAQACWADPSKVTVEGGKVGQAGKDPMAVLVRTCMLVRGAAALMVWSCIPLCTTVGPLNVNRVARVMVPAVTADDDGGVDQSERWPTSSMVHELGNVGLQTLAHTGSGSEAETSTAVWVTLSMALEAMGAAMQRECRSVRSLAKKVKGSGGDWSRGLWTGVIDSCTPLVNAATAAIASEARACVVKRGTRWARGGGAEG